MKRDKELMRLLLLQARDGEKHAELEKYPESAQIYNAALLIEDGFVRGEALPGHDGGYIAAAIDGLTSAGHDLLDEWDAHMNTPVSNDDENKSLAVFVSHSAKDADVAEALVNLLRSAIGLTEKDIRCTSVDGYRFEVGAETDAQLRKELLSSKAFIGLITLSSIRSAYVLFELGARWGADLHLAPVLAAGADITFLRGPLEKLNALDATKEAQLYQLVSDVALKLGRQSASAAVYSRAVRELASLASKERSSKEDELPEESTARAQPSTFETVLKIVAEEKTVNSKTAALQRVLGQVDASLYLEGLEHIGLVTAIWDDLAGRGYERQFTLSVRGKEHLRRNKL